MMRSAFGQRTPHAREQQEWEEEGAGSRERWHEKSAQRPKSMEESNLNVAGKYSINYYFYYILINRSQTTVDQQPIRSHETYVTRSTAQLGKNVFYY